MKLVKIKIQIFFSRKSSLHLSFSVGIPVVIVGEVVTTGVSTATGISTGTGFSTGTGISTGIGGNKVVGSCTKMMASGDVLIITGISSTGAMISVVVVTVAVVVA
ncbi:hypothetical protein BpHYR1_034374 [Brachionus plicatilis]|uniref:Uncharacterized protein n=1 Tax=Brachionus plicatilis TaxID=10195 RepID=A0A3M7SVQ5_BRAPC|nr:hypothetical protein BpHYR1_034374 [Brachionus plicatilis]